MNITLSRIALMSAITLTGSNALAQANAGTPAAVGTTSQAAADATQKAVPRSDTGTVVRTSPSAVDKARQVAPAPPLIDRLCQHGRRRRASDEHASGPDRPELTPVSFASPLSSSGVNMNTPIIPANSAQDSDGRLVTGLFPDRASAETAYGAAHDRGYTKRPKVPASVARSVNRWSHRSGHLGGRHRLGVARSRDSHRRPDRSGPCRRGCGRCRRWPDRRACRLEHA